MNTLVASLAGSKSSVLDSAEGRARLPKLEAIAVEVTYDERPFRGLSGFVQLIGNSFDLDAVALTKRALQLDHPSR